ncbi:major facilitator superfamily domain-containing protein [Kockovaella imperatae]|uniref:Major facilitator superfamily domain-containing protein n=1 Tax=Kockovaella imperatae TaxID=4999 RepID=A0A1Y1UPD6_9TREE|nr:major facilitator superfamily domain-containing protein [Kockovaella imperatae]ORX39437.1 major facilitator superfamily domain-containing protein [Kockovaella imperatae]
MMVTYFLQAYDKGILSSSTQFGILDDLHLSKVIGHTKSGKAITDNKKFANVSMIFYIGYLVGTYPMMLLAQRYSPSRVLGGATIIWGAVVMSTAGCTTYAGLMVNRVFLGVFESAVAPGFTVLVTFWWTREEQALRLSFWYSCVGLATVVSPLLNYALGQIHSHFLPWKPLFLILGAVTVVWGFVLTFTLPDDPLKTKGLNEDERKIAIARLERNRAGTINHNFKGEQIKEAFTDYKVWSSALIILLTGVPSGALGTFGTLVINGFGYNHFHSLALTCPIGAITFVSIMAAGYLNRRVPNMRYITILVTVLISMAGTLICWIKGPTGHKGLLYAGILLLAIQVAAGGLAVSLAASNIAGHTKKSMVSATTFVGYCVGNIIGPNIFGASPAPVYHAGFMGSTICLALVAVIATASYIALRMENARRDRRTGEASARVYHHHFDEDLSDKQNEDYRYIL